MKNTNIIFLLSILFLLSPLSCKDNINHIDVDFANINKIIYDYFKADTMYVNMDLAWLLNYQGENILLFNSPAKEDFQIIDYIPETNFPIQFIPTKDFNHQVLTAPLILLNKDIHNLNDLTSADIIMHMLNISQKLYINYLKKHSRETVDYPSLEYPLTHEQNLVLSTFEYKILINAFETSLSGSATSRQEVLRLLEQFYSIRVRRWRSSPAVVQSFEQSQEKILGLSFYQAVKLALDFEEKMRNTPQSPIVNVQLPNVFELLNMKMQSLFEGDLIGFNSMAKPKSEMIGFLLAYLYDYLGWGYRPEHTRENFHAFLGTKLNLSTTQIDTFYNSYIARNDLEALKERVTELKKEYQEAYLQNLITYNFQIMFDHPTDEIHNVNEVFFVNSEEKNIIFPHTKKYIIKSNFTDIEIKDQGFLYHQNRKQKIIKANIRENARFVVDNRTYRLDRLIETLTKNDDQTSRIANLVNPGFVQNMEFDNLMITSPELTFNTRAKGEITLIDGVLAVKLAPTMEFNIEDAYINLITELNLKLLERGVPDGWLAENLNHNNFRVYHSVVRSFTNMPEHQVQRGERDDDWYMRNFGVDDKVRRGPAFKQAHLETLEAAEKRFGIHYELIMAILAIESDYANPRWRGNFYTFPTLVSQYILLPRRQRFAVNELVALYHFSKFTENDTYHFIGSFAGAAGWGQFIPTSMRGYYVDSNNNPKDIDIYCIDDTIHSIANYLNKHGLNSGNIGNYRSRYNAVHAYNKSDAYVKAVLYIYDKLREQR